MSSPFWPEIRPAADHDVRHLEVRAPEPPVRPDPRALPVFGVLGVREDEVAVEDLAEDGLPPAPVVAEPRKARAQAAAPATAVAPTAATAPPAAPRRKPRRPGSVLARPDRSAHGDERPDQHGEERRAEPRTDRRSGRPKSSPTACAARVDRRRRPGTPGASRSIAVL